VNPMGGKGNFIIEFLTAQADKRGIRTKKPVALANKKKGGENLKKCQCGVTNSLNCHQTKGGGYEEQKWSHSRPQC